MIHANSRKPWFNRKWARLALTGLSLFAVVSLACNLPFVGDLLPPSNSDQTQEATEAAPSLEKAGPLQGPQVTLPPALVETSPLPAGTILPDGPLTLYFNQPMDRSSVEGSLQVQPAAGGSFEWIDDSTVAFYPDQPFPADTRVSISVSEGAKAQNGLAMLAPVEAQYQTAPPLRVIEQLPAPDSLDVDPTSAVAVTFNQPVIMLGGDLDAQPPAFTLEPAAEGTGRWLNTSTYIFYGDPALAGGVEFTVRLDPALSGVLGAQFEAEADLEWSFSTAVPRLVSATPVADQPIDLDQVFTFTFNQPMDRDSIQQNLLLIDPQGQPVPGTFTWEEADTLISFQPDDLLQRNTSYTLEVGAGITGRGGTLLENPQVSPVMTVPELGVIGVEPSIAGGVDVSFGYGSVAIKFTSPLARIQDFESRLSIEPALASPSISTSVDGRSLYITASFEPNQSYQLTFSSELEDKWGDRMNSAQTVTVQTLPYLPTLSIPILMVSGNAIFVTPQDTAFSAEAVNLTRLQLASSPVDIGEFLTTLRDYTSGMMPANAQNWTQTLTLPPNEQTPISIPLTANQQSLATGLYLFSITAPEEAQERFQRQPFFVVSSRIHLTMKTAPGELLIWAVNLDQDAPAPDLELVALDTNGSELGRGRTGADGLLSIALPDSWTPITPIVVTSGQPGDEFFTMASSLWSQGQTHFYQDIWTNYWETEPEVYLYTDRPVYRPGQTVYFRVVAQERAPVGYRPLVGQPVTLKIYGSYSPEIGDVPLLHTAALDLSAFGTASGEYTLPEELPSGSYSVVLEEYPTGSLNFQVASYRKPEIEMEVDLASDDFTTDEEIHARVDARYFFGAAATDLPVRWSLLIDSLWLDLPQGYQAGRPDRSVFTSPMGFFFPGQRLLLEGDGQTGPGGTFELSISPEELQAVLPEDFDFRKLILEVTISEESGRLVTGRDQANLHRGDFLIGVQPEVWSVRAGDELGFQIQTLDWALEPVAGKVLQAQFSRVVWRPSSVSPEMGWLEYEPEYTPVSSVDMQTGPDGRARITFIPPDPGTYQLHVEGENVVTELIVWVSGEGAAIWPQLPNQYLQLEASATDFRPGETAEIFIPNPLQPGALAWVTVERDRVMRSMMIVLGAAGEAYELPLEDADAPNVYVSVTILGRTAEGKLDFRGGYVELSVEPVEPLLSVQLTADPQQVEPGGRVNLELSVTDAAGEPVVGEFSLAVVDRAVLALVNPNAPAIAEAFYGRQPLRVMTGLSLAAYIGRLAAAPLGRGGGGGGGDLGLVSEIRSEFADTAFWTGTLTTDQDGTASVEVTLPDNLTSWEVRARGLDETGRVGEATVEITATKPLLIRPVTPRFLVSADHVRLGAVVHNNTADALQVEVGLAGSGFTLDVGQPAVQSIDLPAGEEQFITWWGTASGEAVDLVFRASGGNLEDAATPGTGSIPVVRYMAPQAFGTAGVLTQGGSRLELVSLPRSFDPTAGRLRVELNASLVELAITDLKVFDDFPFDITEPVISRLLANLQMLRLARAVDLGQPDLEPALVAQVQASLDWLLTAQNSDGGWGWSLSKESSPHISPYGLLALAWASDAGFAVSPEVISSTQSYLLATLISPEMAGNDRQLDELAFEYFALAESGLLNVPPDSLIPFVDRLSPSGRAYLLAALSRVESGSPEVQALVENLRGSAVRSATGAYWEEGASAEFSFHTSLATTAIVSYVLAQVDPASPVLTDAVRYLATYSCPLHATRSSYEAAWTLLALVEYAQGTGDLQPEFDFSARVNDLEIAKGQARGLGSGTVFGQAEMQNLYADQPNALEIERSDGPGRLYYRGFLEVERPAAEAEPIEAGLSLTRQYFLDLEGDEPQDSVQSVDLNAENPIINVTLTLVVPKDSAFVMVEDIIPAGMEIVDPSLRTSETLYLSQQPFDPRSPFADGWGWWFFGAPRIQDDRVRWVSDLLPAGTYVLTYRLQPQQPGEFSVLPARAWQYYFPDVQATTAGSRFTISE